jgi:sulfur-oxidizing protein SoxY
MIAQMQERAMVGHVAICGGRALRWNWLYIAALAAALQIVPPNPSSAATPEETWASLAAEIFKGRPLAEGTGLLGIEMPARAEDAAIVPVTLRVTLPPGDGRRLNKLTLVIDENPAPVAATFEFGEQAGVSMISTRVRVNSYTNVHAVAELNDGMLYVVKTFVKASGGCSAPAAKNADEAIASLGQMRLRVFGRQPARGISVAREAQVMIRHPNNSGLQRDQITLLYVPAHFVDELTVSQGDAMVFRMKGGISISEDPNFRFNYIPNGAANFRVEAKDTAGKVFRREFPTDQLGL